MQVRVAKTDSISFDIDLLKECMLEMEPIVDKKRFFHQLISERLEACNKRCIDDFNSQLDMIERQLDPDNLDLDKLCRTIKSMSKISTSLYRTQITLYKVL